jgi:ElaA protein
MNISWRIKSFDTLTPSELYDFIKLRQEIFVVEQHCAYLDADGKDPHCWHLMGYSNETLACYARIVHPGISYKEVSIGRVAASQNFRRTGLGNQLLKESLRQIKKIYGDVPIRIGAQAYLQKFYESFGFEITEPAGYFEDGILHYIMLRKGS